MKILHGSILVAGIVQLQKITIFALVKRVWEADWRYG